MTILKVVTVYDDEDGVLRKKAEPVAEHEFESAEFQTLIDDMIHTLKASMGVGLAAPQIGVSKKVFVLDDGSVCVNPWIEVSIGKIKSRSEGCLSVPGRRFTIKRARKTIMHCRDRFGQLYTLKPRRKIYNIAIQHEVDHLQGRLVSDTGEED